MGKPPARCCSKLFANVGFWIMVVSALLSTMVSLQEPAFEYVTYTYRLQPKDSMCDVDGYNMGSEFEKVMGNYNLLVGVITATCNMLLLKLIKKYRKTGTFSTVFCFFFLIVLPIRLIHFALQVIEFDVIGGKKYTWLISNRIMYPDCDLFTGGFDAVTLMHLRTLFLTLDFITLNLLILTVSFVYSSVEAELQL